MGEAGSKAEGGSERERLIEAERHQRILSDVSRTLLDYVGPDDIEPLRRIVEMVAVALGDWCTFSLVQQDGILRQVAAHHPDPAQRDLAEKLSRVQKPQRWDAAPPEYNILLSRKPLVLEHVTDEILRIGDPTDEEFALVKSAGLTSLVAAPMFDGPRPLGTMLLASVGPGGRRYLPSDIDFAFALAGRAALAVRNARLVHDLALERDQQKAAREDSDRRAAELVAVFSADPNGILLFDAEGKLLLASERADELLGQPISRRPGTGYRALFGELVAVNAPIERQSALLRRLEEIFNDPASRTQDDLELWPRGVHRWLRRTTVPVLTRGGTFLGHLFVYVDVTAERELDQKRADFLTVAAHELRTPLTPLSMYLQSIERRLQRGVELEPELAVKARRQVQRLGKLVEDLLDVSRLESGRLELVREPLSLDGLVDEVVADFRGNSQAHEIVFRRPPQPVTVSGDRQRLEQVVVNLLGNALKYSPQGGQIVVTVERGEREARVSVDDPGIGIPAEEQPRLFQRFFRAANANTRHFGGLGIGLFVSYEIVQRHGGRFSVQSERGQGATFAFTLPLSEDGQTKATSARILLVDDDPAILEATSGVLREWGYTVDEARDGNTALGLARNARPDLMLIDLMMPVLDGWTLIARLREEKLSDGVPLVVFSADRDASAKARKIDADAALRKPFELEELQRVVEELLSRRRPEA